MKAFLNTILYQPFLNLMVALLWVLPGHNLGVAIIVLTILVRLALNKPAAVALKTQLKMQQLQPVINRIRKEYKGDVTRQNQEMMKIYAAEKVSPYGGCLPLLIQLPILIVLYSVFRTDFANIPAGSLYSFTPTVPQVNNIFLGLDLTHFERINFPLTTHMWMVVALGVVSALFQYIQMKMLQPKVRPEGDATADMTRQMSITMPALSFIIALTLPPALPLYWVVTTAYSIAQQWWFLNRGKLEPVQTVELQPVSSAIDPLPEEKLEKKGDVTIKIRKKS